MVTTPPTKRIFELDFIRGLCVLLMIFDHTLFDLGFVFLQQWFPAGGDGLLYTLCDFAKNFYWDHPIRIIVRVAVLACFFGICGICCSFSHSNWMRGLKLLAVAMLLTAATALMDYVSGLENVYIIRFGVLHMLAVSILLYAALQRTGHLVPFLVGAGLILLSFYLQAHPMDVNGLIPFILGIGGGSYSADYFPLLPWTGYFLIGAALGTLLYRKKRSFFPRVQEGLVLRGVGFTGRHALWFYVLHQPVVYGFLLLLGMLLQL